MYVSIWMCGKFVLYLKSEYDKIITIVTRNMNTLKASDLVYKMQWRMRLC